MERFHFVDETDKGYAQRKTRYGAFDDTEGGFVVHDSGMAGWSSSPTAYVYRISLANSNRSLTDKITCSCATHIIPEGEGVKQDLQRCITNKPMEVLGYGNIRGVNLNYWKKTSKKQDELLTFIFVGRIVREKGMNELVEAFVKLNQEYPKTRLLLVGPYEEDLDPVSPKTKNLIDTYPSIEAVGSQKDVRPFYEQSDVLVFPSYREGFPNVVIEAGAMELPSIVTDINGSREIINHGENGVIVPSQNEHALWEAMKWMVEHPMEREKMAEKARPMVAERYEEGFVRKCLKDYYKKILSC